MESYAAIEEIVPLFDFQDRFSEIEELLCKNSNLPSPRGNLTLAFEFANQFENDRMSEELFNLLVSWTNITPEEAPTNQPREYLAFCGVLSLGAYYYYADPKTKSLIMDYLKRAMSDKRWRTREAAAMGLQKIAEKDFDSIENYFLMWYNDSNHLEKRAFIATLAHPPILKNKETALFSLRISEKVLEDIFHSNKEDRRSEAFTVLSKGLQYALSVFTAELPEEGFALLKKYAGLNDPDLNKIIKVNLGKSRLAKKYALRVEEIFNIVSK
jgi:hypothetical protein